MTDKLTDPAPFRDDLADGPGNGYALWRETPDGVRLRIGVWPAENAVGTILLFNGRTEYIEKYGRVAVDLTAAGYNVVSLDWRGQGLSARLNRDPMLGYVRKFTDYQKDVATLVATVRDLGLAGPLYLLAHSMGGGIGLRSLLEGLPVRRAVFSAPMWGIYVEPLLRPFAPLLFVLSVALGLGLRYAPGIGNKAYILETDFKDNSLTTDPDHWKYFCDQLNGERGFWLGGASLHWALEAYRETRILQQSPRPGLPVLAFVGTREEVVDPVQIKAMFRDWPSATLEHTAGSKHEVLMEAPGIRDDIIAKTIAFFDADRA